MNELASELNRALAGTIAEELLSDFGRRFYFPKGIVSQSAEAKEYAHRINATIGIAVSDGQPLFLPFIKEYIHGLSPREIFSYAPTPGSRELRDLWKEEILEKNPDLSGKGTSLPLVVSGLTHGISVTADLFADPGDTVIVPDMFWGNYRLIFEGRNRADLVLFPFFDSRGGLNITALGSSLDQARGGKAILILNFPNNPTGYSPTREEAASLVRLLQEKAAGGLKMLVITDDAYFGLFYEDSIYKQSLFAELAGLHENILAVKIDGATKEELVWGFRIGFITFASRGLTGEHYGALTRKAMGAIRSSVSNANNLAQSLLIKALKSESHRQEKELAFQILKGRYKKVTEILRVSDSPLKALPFNSGYFMTFLLSEGSAEELRKRLLMDYGIGTISIRDKYLRVAYSAVEEEMLAELYDLIFRAALKE